MTDQTETKREPMTTEAYRIGATNDMYDALKWWEMLGPILLKAFDAQLSTSIKAIIAEANSKTEAALAKARGEA